MKYKVLLVFILTLYYPSLLLAQDSEINVTGDIWRLIPPDQARITALIEIPSAPSADEAFKSADSKFKAITDSLKKLNITISNRGFEITAGAGKNSQITLGSSIHLQHFIAIETKDLASISGIIDLTLKAGATSIVDVEYLVSTEHPLIKTALQESTNIAKNKASEIANSLGVTLGDLISIITTEEPIGSISLEERRNGDTPAGRYSDQQIHVLVNVRYKINQKI